MVAEGDANQKMSAALVLPDRAHTHSMGTQGSTDMHPRIIAYMAKSFDISCE